MKPKTGGRSKLNAHAQRANRTLYMAIPSLEPPKKGSLGAARNAPPNPTPLETSLP